VVSDFVESEWRVPADLSGGMLLLSDLLCLIYDQKRTNAKRSLETKMTLQSINNSNRRRNGNLVKLTGNIYRV
jgi:hypothetical protein